MTLSVREVQDAHQLEGLQLAPLDEAECWAGGLGTQEALARSVAGSEASWLYMADGAPLCVWGYRPRSLVVGGVDVWLLGTPMVKGHGVAFARESKRLASALFREFGSLRALVWEGHAPALRWLTWLGFEARTATSPFVVMETRRSWGS